MNYGVNGEVGEEDDEDMVDYEEGDEDEEDPDLEIIDHDKENSNGHGEMQQNKDGQVSTPKKVESPIRNKRLNFSKVPNFPYAFLFNWWRI